MSVAEILHYTYDDYCQWEGEWELIDGVPVSMAPAPAKLHQQLSGAVFILLSQTIQEECAECEAV